MRLVKSEIRPCSIFIQENGVVADEINALDLESFIDIDDVIHRDADKHHNSN